MISAGGSGPGVLPLPVPPSRGSSASPPGTDSGGRGGGGRLHSSPAGRCCARTGDRRLPERVGPVWSSSKPRTTTSCSRASAHCGAAGATAACSSDRVRRSARAGWGEPASWSAVAGARPGLPPEQRLGGWAGRLEMSAPVLRGAAASLARTPVSVRRERPVPPFSVPPPVSGAWGVGTGSLRKPLPASSFAGFALSSAGKFWVRIPCSSVEALAGLSLLTSLCCSQSLIKE